MSLSELGYHRPTYDEILEDKILLAQNLFGADIETSELTPLGKFIRIGAKDLSRAYEDIEAVYYARFPNTATGISLDRLCVFVGISRNPATFAEYTITINGTAGTEVEEILVCGENPDIVFHNFEPFVVGDDGTVNITVGCETVGTTGNAITINAIVNPIANIDSISFCEQTRIAEDVESDYDLRQRFAMAIEGYGGSSVEAIRAAVLQVTNVKSVFIVENATNKTDGDGRPPHSFETYVYGGEDYEQEIADAIWGIKPAGIQTVGDQAVTILDACGNEQVIYYSPATTIGVFVKISIKTDDDFPADGEEQITTNIAERINELDLGESLILSRLYGCAYRVGGVPEVTSLEVSTDGVNFTGNNVASGANSIIICAGVTVEVVD